MLNPSKVNSRYERVPVRIFDSSGKAITYAAKEIQSLIKSRSRDNKQTVLGLATGSSPTALYDELVRMHREEGLSFSSVVTFNLDEYYPMQPEALQSYVRYMHEYLFDHVDIDPANIFIPDGTVSADYVQEYCLEYESKIDEYGGIDLQVLGIGRTGHIGFNEPGSAKNSITRLITLDNLTRSDAAADFFGKQFVPRRAITMGIGSIFKARRILLLAWGEGKSDIIGQTVEGPVQENIPASFLQEHEQVEFLVDQAAAAKLTQINTPWLVRPCTWTTELRRKAVIWLSNKVAKPILKLTDEFYNEHGMGDLIAEQGPAYNINIQIFNEVQHTITGWPGGKPNADDSHRPERAKPFPKRCLVFSPHPDDDVISMGGTLLRLVEQGHDVHVAYQTSGNIAVFDDDALRFVDFARDFFNQVGHRESAIEKIHESVQLSLKDKQPGQVDSDLVQNIKALIREGEAKAAARFCGVKPDHVHFLKMPFYETGRIRKNPLGMQDINVVKSIIKEIDPHQIYAAGDLSDPHGTHRICLQAVQQAVQAIKGEGLLANCRIWLYRGAWQEWDIDEIQMAVPLSPDELLRKRQAIFKHQSQKDTPAFPGTDEREFWQRAEDRNRHTAQLYDELGLAEYEAIEAFVEWIPQ